MDELEFYDGAWTGQEIDAGIGLTGTLANALAVVVDGNKAAGSAAVGQYVLVKNSTITGITDGLYKAAKVLPANTTLDGTYFSTAVTAGGLNSLKAALSSLGATVQSVTGDTDVTVNSGGYIKIGKAVFVDVDIFISETKAANTSVLNGFPLGPYVSPIFGYLNAFNKRETAHILRLIGSDFYTNANMEAGTYHFSGVYFSN